ncbi:MAG: ABC transporter ATP-binding protein [Chloroflexi bacterium]|nr:ABC transporter ATP-binding protein [Chloroflexota bacterium]MYA94150.1 ABC transporter ATP-binding protein [Chloroflexota bacterium]MYD38207.1 ABC transporter ATP-binding protein [Chloroflexota bacterium]MYE79803.1 ABC transporter ATP-binding protein [Chloroflexota bacterium]MYH65650.1 ABC transporter ATP-binding protein [Chloroflexota bacterium]
MAEKLLQVENLKTHLPLEEGLLKAVDGISFTMGRGETLGLVGESGCGKSLAVSAIMRLNPSFAEIQGNVTYYPLAGAPIELTALDAYGPEIRAIRGGEIAMIFQEPMTSFSPLHTIGNQITEAIRIHRRDDKQAAAEIAIDLLRRVGMSNPAQRMNEYPHQLSGGMRQRAMIAMALSCEPSLLIADEPTTALDVTVQAQVLQLMRDLQHEFGMSILYITHDLGVIARMVQTVAVMYLGRIVEITDVDSLFYTAKHPYTEALIQSVPKLGKKSRARLESIRGAVPVPINRPPGCGFFPRCAAAIEGLCDRHDPPLMQIEDQHAVACFVYPQVVDALGDSPREGAHHAA